jgi:hypothetical protein
MRLAPSHCHARAADTDDYGTPAEISLHSQPRSRNKTQGRQPLLDCRREEWPDVATCGFGSSQTYSGLTTVPSMGTPAPTTRKGAPPWEACIAYCLNQSFTPGGKPVQINQLRLLLLGRLGLRHRRFLLSPKH